LNSFPATNDAPTERSSVELPTTGRQYFYARYMENSTVLSARTKMEITSPACVTCLYFISLKNWLQRTSRFGKVHWEIFL